MISSLRPLQSTVATALRSSTKRALPSSSRLIQRNFNSSKNAWARVLCCDNIDPICVDIFEQNGHQVDYKSKLSQDELCSVIGQYDGLVVRSATKVTPEVIANMTNMKVVGRAGVGVDNIDVPECTRNGIMVMNTPGGNTVSTAQLAFTLITSMARNVAAADMSMKEGKFERKKYMGVELKGKTLAVVGCGRIGQTVAKWAQKMGMDVIGFDPAMADSVAEDLGIKLVSLSEVWPAADFITLHTPLTPDTRNLICGETISKMKDGVRIVNCARGGIINEADLLSALESGKVAGAAMDVYQKEPPSSEESLALIAHPNVVCTPHLGASTDEAQINVAKDIAKQMCATFEGKEYVGVLNVDYMEHTTDIRLEPFFALSEILGQLQAQTTKNHGKITAVEVECWGEHGVSLMRPKVQKLLKAVVLKGMLKHLQDEVEPTLISAPFLARELGIQPSMGTMTRFANKDSHPYTNLVSAKVRLEDGQEHVITGSVFGTQPHLVQIDNFLSFPAFTPEGTLLMFKNQDRPGVISSVLQTLTDHNINIGKMALARQEGPLALCLMSVDSPLNESIIEELKASSELQDVQCAAFS